MLSASSSAPAARTPRPLPTRRVLPLPRATCRRARRLNGVGRRPEALACSRRHRPDHVAVASGP